MKSAILLATLLYFLSNGNTSSTGRLIWSDEFNYSGALDGSKWNYELGDGCPHLCGWGNNEPQIYTSDLSNVRAEGGLLIIEAKKNGDKWTSGRITSQSKMNFTHGRVVFRAKLPLGKGTWPALWMLGERVTSDGWPACGEIDVMEHVGKNPRVVQSALHSRSSYGDTINKGDTIINTVDTDFHVYEANWKKDRIEFLVDGHNYYTYQPVSIDKETWPFDSPFYIIMNIAVGGNFGGPVIDPTLTLARMEVDYVRVYQ